MGKIKLLQYEVEILQGLEDRPGLFFNFQYLEDAIKFVSAAIHINHMIDIRIYSNHEICEEDTEKFKVIRTQIFRLRQ